MKKGTVYLIGAGPGSVELLTLKALRLLQACDVVLYDNLVSNEILQLIPRNVVVENVGKRQASHPVPQAEINQRLIDLALEGKQVVRLKGGDPFIFGRGGEEIEGLKKYQIPFEVIPGVSAANGAAAYAGIPLTHRDYAQSCLWVTAHLKEGSFDLDWPSLVRERQTVVIYMGLHGLKRLSEQLLEAGMPAQMPAALIENATLPYQRVLVTQVSNMFELSHAQGFKSPTLLIIGHVVKLQDKIAWYSSE